MALHLLAARRGPASGSDAAALVGTGEALDAVRTPPATGPRTRRPRRPGARARRGRPGLGPVDGDTVTTVRAAGLRRLAADPGDVRVGREPHPGTR